MLQIDTVSYVNAIANYKRALSIDIEPQYIEGRLDFVCGGGGVIFKVLYCGELYALKCFNSITDDLLKIYRDTYSKAIASREGFISDSIFLEDAITVASLTEYITAPLLLTRWVEGNSLSREIEERCSLCSRESLSELTNNFILFAYRLLSSSTIHSDIKCDNIITDGTKFTLIDIDALTNSECNLWYENKLISPWYNHPKIKHHSRLRDHYPIAIIVASLITLEAEPSLMESFIDGESLIFRPEMLIKRCDPAFNSVRHLFDSHPTLKHLGDYISSSSLPHHNLAPLLFDIAAMRSLVRYSLRDRSPNRDNLYTIEGYRSLIGFAREDGELAIAADYDDAREFSDSLAAVSKDGAWFFINKHGKKVFNREFRAVTSFREGVAAVAQGRLWGYIDQKGNYLIKPKYDSARPFSQGRAHVVVNGQQTVIDISGKELL